MHDVTCGVARGWRARTRAAGGGANLAVERNDRVDDQDAEGAALVVSVSKEAGGVDEQLLEMVAVVDARVHDLRGPRRQEGRGGGMGRGTEAGRNGGASSRTFSSTKSVSSW